MHAATRLDGFSAARASRGVGAPEWLLSEERRIVAKPNGIFKRAAGNSVQDHVLRQPYERLRVESH